MSSRQTQDNASGAHSWLWVLLLPGLPLVGMVAILIGVCHWPWYYAGACATAITFLGFAWVLHHAFTFTR